MLRRKSLELVKFSLDVDFRASRLLISWINKSKHLLSKQIKCLLCEMMPCPSLWVPGPDLGARHWSFFTLHAMTRISYFSSFFHRQLSKLSTLKTNTPIKTTIKRTYHENTVIRQSIWSLCQCVLGLQLRELLLCPADCLQAEWAQRMSRSLATSKHKPSVLSDPTWNSFEANAGKK